jgi:hypothetical protein
MYPNRRVDPGESCRYAQQQRRESDMGEPAVRTRKWTRREYDRLAEAEILGPEDRVELLRRRDDRQGAAGQPFRTARLPSAGATGARHARPLRARFPLAAPAAAVAVADLLP